MLGVLFQPTIRRCTVIPCHLLCKFMVRRECKWVGIMISHDYHLYVEGWPHDWSTFLTIPCHSPECFLSVCRKKTICQKKNISKSSLRNSLLFSSLSSFLSPTHFRSLWAAAWCDRLLAAPPPTAFLLFHPTPPPGDNPSPWISNHSTAPTLRKQFPQPPSHTKSDFQDLIPTCFSSRLCRMPFLFACVDITCSTSSFCPWDRLLLIRSRPN